MCAKEEVCLRGRRGVQALIAIVGSGANNGIPDLVRTCVAALSIQVEALKEQIRILTANSCSAIQNPLGWDDFEFSCPIDPAL